MKEEARRLYQKLAILKQEEKTNPQKDAYIRTTNIGEEFCEKLKRKLVEWNVIDPNDSVIFNEDGSWKLYDADNLNKPIQRVEAILNYKKAIAWAAENGVTNGVSDTLFAPDDTLTTAHIVTFLYRAHNPGENGWYEGAAAWAKERGCFDDLEIAVDNRTDCPRAHVVMLLFKLMG